MQYMVLIYSREADMNPPKTDEEREALFKPWNEYTEALKSAGVFVAGDALQSTGTATTITQVDTPEPVFTDGPFAETKEQLGGYYLLDCKDLDEALAWASKCPIVHYGKAEVRPLMAY